MFIDYKRNENNELTIRLSDFTNQQFIELQPRNDALYIAIRYADLKADMAYKLTLADNNLITAITHRLVSVLIVTNKHEVDIMRHLASNLSTEELTKATFEFLSNKEIKEFNFFDNLDIRMPIKAEHTNLTQDLLLTYFRFYAKQTPKTSKPQAKPQAKVATRPQSQTTFKPKTNYNNTYKPKTSYNSNNASNANQQSTQEPKKHYVKYNPLQLKQPKPRQY